MPDCVLAKNGEFTQRAFMNGKIPLSKAESILDIIESNSEATHSIALNQYTGHVYESISNCREQLLTLLQKWRHHWSFLMMLVAFKEKLY